MTTSKINYWERKLLDLTMSIALGVEGLKNFLYYAENGVLPVDENAAQAQEQQVINPLAERIAEATIRQIVDKIK